MEFLKTILERFSSETPKFWNKVAKFGAVLTVISVGLLGANEAGVELPEVFVTISGYLATAGFVLTVVAKATTTDNELTNK